MISDLLDFAQWLATASTGLDALCAGIAGLPGLARLKDGGESTLVQEQVGFHLGIAPEIKATGRQAARVAKERYDAWLASPGSPDDTEFKRQYFTIAVGGGNTVKNEYKALLKYHFYDIDWLEHIRFFFLEETCNAPNWQSTRVCLVDTLLEPLARKLIASEGSHALTKTLDLKRDASREEIVERMVEVMTVPIDASEIESSIAGGDRELALEHARAEARRYQRLVRKLLGPAMSFHLLISGFGKNGGIGAFPPYTPELKKKKAAVIVVENPNGAISVALNRGVLTAAECISLIVSGSLKLRALGRFEMEDSAAFEQTVMETPIRMLRESTAIAEKVYIFADKRALHFDEDVFRYNEKGKLIEIRSEVREGDEEGGVHILLVHGFMGLYSYINLLIRLPSAWKISALRRGKHARTLPAAEIFPHYADSVRRKILRNWRSKRPTPICCHSFAGSISDHLLLSVLENYDDPLPDLDQLAPDDRQLIEALQTAGIIHIATWAPSDLCHITPNIEAMRASRGKKGKQNVAAQPPTEIYDLTTGGTLTLNREHREGLESIPPVLETVMKVPGIERLIDGITVGVRYLAHNVDFQKLRKQQEVPYAHRLMSERVLKKVSFYGVMKEASAALSQHFEYQDRHLKALDAVVKYDIPYLVIVHREDMMVSAHRHVEEHEYLIAQRLKKEGVKHKRDLELSAQLLLLDRVENEPSDDFIDPHFLIVSTTPGGGSNARMVTAAITSFVNENMARAMNAGQIEPLNSVDKWVRGEKR